MTWQSRVCQLRTIVHSLFVTKYNVSSRNPLCLAGLIFGTGSNACYVEKLKNVHTWDGDYDNPDEVRGRTFGWKNLRE